MGHGGEERSYPAPKRFLGPLGPHVSDWGCQPQYQAPCDGRADRLLSLVTLSGIFVHVHSVILIIYCYIQRMHINIPLGYIVCCSRDTLDFFGNGIIP